MGVSRGDPSPVVGSQEKLAHESDYSCCDPAEKKKWAS